jgi:pilus assembly protein CpaF
MEDNIKDRLHNYLINKTNFLKVKDKMQEDELRAFVSEAITDMCYEEQMKISEEQRLDLIRELVTAVISLGPLKALIEDKEITEIMINGADNVFIQKDGKIQRVDIQFNNNQHLLHTIQKILASSGTNRRVDESSPYVDFNLSDGSRVNVLLPPCSLMGPLMTIRKFADINTIEDFLKLGMLNKDMGTFLTLAMKAKLNVVFCGATGTGKTTTLNVFSRHIPEEERIITIEDTPELRLQQEHVVSLQAKSSNIEGKGAVSIRDLFVNSLRMRPDRIIIGEVRSDEMLDLIESISSGHSGSLAIVHAESPEDCFSRMVTMMLMTGIRLATDVIVKQVIHAIDVIVHCELHPDGVRRITHITDLIWDEQKKDVGFVDIFRFVHGDIGKDNKIKGHWNMRKKKPTFLNKFKKRNVELPAGLFE